MTVRNIASICNMVSAGGGRAARQPLRGPAGGCPGAQPNRAAPSLAPAVGEPGRLPRSAWDGVGRRRLTMSRGVFREQPGRGPGRDADAERVRGPPERVWPRPRRVADGAVARPSSACPSSCPNTAKGPKLDSEPTLNQWPCLTLSGRHPVVS